MGFYNETNKNISPLAKLNLKEATVGRVVDGFI